MGAYRRRLRLRIQLPPPAVLRTLRGRPGRGQGRFRSQRPGPLRASHLWRYPPRNYLRVSAGCPPQPLRRQGPSRRHPRCGGHPARGPRSLLDQAPLCLRRRQHGRLPPGPTPAGGLLRLGYCRGAGHLRRRRLPWSTWSRATPDIPCGHERRFRGRDPRGFPLAHPAPATGPAWTQRIPPGSGVYHRPTPFGDRSR